MKKTRLLSLFLLFLTMLMFNSCRTDDLQKQDSNQKATINSQIIRLNELKKNSKLIAELQTISKSEINTESTVSRMYTDSENGFSVDLDDVLYTEDPYGAKTYTFKIIRDKPKENLENLVMVQKEDGFETFIFEYEKEIELNYFKSNRELKDAIREHVTITNLGRKTDITPMGKMHYVECQDVIVAWVETPGTPCASGLHTFEDGAACTYWGTINMAFPAYGGHYEFTFTSGNCSGGGGGGSGTIGTTGPHGGGGGGNGGSISNNGCNKVKATTQNATFKNNVTSLEGKTGDGYESGYRMNKPIPNGSLNDFLQNAQGTNFVNLTAFSNTYALLHSHYDELYPIFSPEDIIFFNQWVNYVITNNQTPNSSIPTVGDISLTVVTSHGNYMLTFDPFEIATQFQNYTEDEIEDLNKDYIKKLDNAKTNSGFDMSKLEKEFLKFVDNKMNFPGMKLFKIESNGTNTEIYLENGERKTRTCP